MRRRSTSARPSRIWMRSAVVRDVGRRRAPVDDAARRGRRGAEDPHVRHDVVAGALLLARGRLEVDVGQVLPHLRERLFGDRQPEAPLLLGEPEPEAPPGLELELRREDAGHLRRRVAVGEGISGPVSPSTAGVLAEEELRSGSSLPQTRHCASVIFPPSISKM